MNTYMTLLSTDKYLDGVIALNQSLKNVGAKYPLVVALTSNISPFCRDILKKLKVEVLELKDFSYSQECYRKFCAIDMKHWFYTSSKLQIFGLTQYQKIIFLDADMFVVKNIDHLFQKPHLTAAEDSPMLFEKDFKKHLNLNSGLLVIEPNKEDEEKLFQLSKEYALPDQDLIRLLKPDWVDKKELHLSVEYNFFMKFFEEYIYSGVKIENVYIFHFIGKEKPFLKNQTYKKIINTQNYIEKSYLNLIHQSIQELTKI